jgi:hypothetical protein
MTARTSDSLVHEAINVGRVDVVVAEGANGVEALLICDNKNDMGTFGFFCHMASVVLCGE